ncbi:YegP family protein [Chitinophaga sedimenti]|uniref:DUF1508 domain-containing protein n=1 Tax=Chitinophaga sedimenti TaxID=2033606 RepID=UPI002003F237|nr:DUF1508 domain-containing protein [Chitinophaga sedimenti]MCK7558687.1 YegP family protein [Chitinophaga sedimenti]
MSTFYIATNPIDNYWFTLRSDSGEKLLHAAGFYTKAACLQGITQIKAAAVLPERYVRKGMEQHRHFFVLLSEKGKSIAVSEIFKTDTEMERALTEIIETVMTANLVFERKIQTSDK